MCRVLGCDGVKAEGKRKTQTTHGDCYSSSSCNSRAHTRTETTIPRSTANDLFQRGPGPLSSMGRVILQPCWGCRGSIVGCGSDNSRASTVSVSNFSASARRTLYGFVGKGIHLPLAKRPIHERTFRQCWFSSPARRPTSVFRRALCKVPGGRGLPPSQRAPRRPSHQ